MRIIQEDNIHKQNFRALPQKYNIVDKYLIRGPHPHFYDVFALKKEGVNKIYDFRHYGIKGFKWIEKLACKLAKIEYIRKPYNFLSEGFPTLQDYETIAHDVLQNGEKGGKTLFHCNSGTHRTALMAAFYDITKGKPLAECKKENPHFHKCVSKAIIKQVINENFFSRNRVFKDSKNPFVKAKNRFNNKVQKAISKAFCSFVSIVHRDPTT